MANPAWFDYDYYMAQKLASLQESDSSWTTTSLVNAFNNAGFVGEEGAYQHFLQFGASEDVSPNSLFNATEYYAAKAANYYGVSPSAVTELQRANMKTAIENAGMNAWTHYQQYGTVEGINSSNSFDTNAYLEAKATALGGDWTAATVAAAIRDAGMSALEHFKMFGGQGEGEITSTQVTTGFAVPSDEQVPASSSDTPSGTTYTLTQGVDNIIGDATDNAINAYLDGGVATLSSLDTVNGGDGTDTLTAFGMDLDNVVETNITNVEKFVFQSTSAGTLDLSKLTGITHLSDLNSTAASTYSNLTPSINVTVAGTAAAHVFNYGSAALSGSADSATFNVNNVTSVLTIGGLSASNKLETLTINATGSASTMELNDAGADDVDNVTTLKVTGTADLDITAESLSVDTTTVDTSGTTGATKIKADAAATNFTFTGGAGNDQIDVGATLASTQTLTGGDGTDTLVVDSAITTGETANVTGFEVLGIDANGGAFTQDMDFFNVNQATILVNGGTVTLNDVQDGLVVNANVTMGGGQDIAINLKTNTAADDVTVNVGATAGGVTLIGLNFDTNYETVTINSQGTAANTITDFGTALNNVLFTGGTAMTVTGTASLTGVLDASAMTAGLTATSSTTALTVTGSDTAADTLTSGVIGGGVTQTFNGGGGNDSIISGNLAATAIMYANGGAGEDTINFNASNTGAALHYIDGGAGFDTITLGQHAGTLDDVISTVTATADADKITGFVTTTDDFDYNGTVKNDSATTITAVSNATLAGGLAADADATVYIVSTALTGAAATDMTALVAETTASGVASKYATFEASLATALGTITGLDTTLGSDEYVLLNVDDGTNSVILRINNFDTSVANTLTAAEIELVGIMVAADDLATGDFI